MTTFADLNLNDKTLKALTDAGYETPTDIQREAIPIVIQGRDLIGLARTGTGKTAGFTLPMLDRLHGGRARARMPRSLILAPTRELAAQIAESFEKYGKYHNLSMALIVGGTSMNDQVKKLDRGVDVLIATPGRLIDHFERGNPIFLTGVQILVIDEADRMLDMGFIPDIEKIASLVSPNRQTLLFSATMPAEISKLTKKFMKDPAEVSVAPPASTAVTVQQYAVPVSQRDKAAKVQEILDDPEVKTAFIFCNRKKDVASLATTLQRKKYPVGPLHGDMPQSARTEALDKFKKGEIKYLVCSDVAARGIDVDSVSHVINHDVPMHPDDYVHRIGRTGRAGKKGVAYTFFSPSEEENLEKVEALTKQKLERLKEDKKVKERPAPKAPAAEKQDKKPAPKKQPVQKKTSKSNNDDGPSPVGFGDDVPAFFK